MNNTTQAPQLMQESSRYEIISQWLNSCTTEEQVNTVSDAVCNRLILEEKTKDDLIILIKQTRKQRAWCRAKVIQADYVQVPERFPVCDEYVDPKGAY